MHQIKKMGDVLSASIYLSNYTQTQTADGYETIYSFNYKKDGIPFHSIQGKYGSIIEVKFNNTDLVKAKKSARYMVQVLIKLILLRYLL